MGEILEILPHSRFNTNKHIDIKTEVINRNNQGKFGAVTFNLSDRDLPKKMGR